MLANLINILIFVLTLTLIAVIAWIAQWGRTRDLIRYLINALIGLIGFLMMAFGGIVMLVSLDIIPARTSLPANTDEIGWMLLLMGIGALPTLIPVMRRILGRFIFPGLDASLPVHTWALFVFWIALISSIFQITVLYDPELIIKSLQDMPLMLMAPVNAVVFVAFSFIAMGIGIDKSPKQVAIELGLTKLPWKTFGQMVGIALLLAIGIQFLEWNLLPLVDDEMRETIERVVKSLQTTGTIQHTLISAVIIGLAAGVGEEVLFRGLIQPVFGIIPTALLFTVIHVHYGPTVLLIELFILGLILGILRQRYNTTAVIVVHTFFDFFVILSSLIP